MAVQLCLDDEAAGGELLISDELRNRLHNTRYAAQCRETMEERPFLHGGQFAGDSSHHGREVLGVASVARLQVFARALLGEVEQGHRLGPVVPVTEAEVHPSVGSIPERTGLASRSSTGRAARPARSLVDGADCPRIDGVGHRFEFADIGEFVLVGLVASVQGRRDGDERGQSAHVPKLSRGQRERWLILQGVDVSPPAAGIQGQAAGQRVCERTVQAERRDREVDRLRVA